MGALLAQLPELLAENPIVVVVAPPGGGKTTRVPPTLLASPHFAHRKIVMLEPRRLAAKAAATFMARQRNEAVGETIGYRTRFESKVTPTTRIEVVTEGILVRRLQTDPTLEDVGIVIFDEFHERNLDGDLALALCRDVQQGIREDLRLVLMSATLDTQTLSARLDNAPVLACAGRQYPVEIHYLSGTPSRSALRDRGASPTNLQDLPKVVERALAECNGSVLVFLPGEAEIRRAAELLKGTIRDSAFEILPLFGNLSPREQDHALATPEPGVRKIVLATSIAETSLTIEGVDAVVDCGLMRVPCFDARTGMTRLETQRVTQASATQRAGRAGRLGPGRCYRLWREAEHVGLLAQRAPEILEADLSPLLLELALWGVDDPDKLTWVDAPPASALAQARALLMALNALDARQRITVTGKEMAKLPLHPRLAYMLVNAKRHGCAALACWIAAVLSEGDPMRLARGDTSVDLRLRLDALAANDVGIASSTRARLTKAAQQYARRLGVKLEKATDIDAAGVILAWAFPDRIGQRRADDGKFRLSNGSGAVMHQSDPLTRSDYIAVALVGGAAAQGRIFLAAPLTSEQVRSQLGPLLTRERDIRWDESRQAVVANEIQKLGSIVFDSQPLRDVEPSHKVAIFLRQVAQRGLATLPWNDAAHQWLGRVRFVGAFLQLPQHAGRWESAASDWPDFSDDGLLREIDVWLGPFVQNVWSLSQLNELNLLAALGARLPWDKLKLLDELAPQRIAVPSGSTIALDYTQGETPVLAVRLQEMFGAKNTPTIAQGTVPVLLHLLSPAARPVQITRDLAGFWAGSYAEVRKEMKGRYPKHNWPEDPANAQAHRSVRARKL